MSRGGARKWFTEVEELRVGVGTTASGAQLEGYSSLGKQFSGSRCTLRPHLCRAIHPIQHPQSTMASELCPPWAPFFG